MDQNVENKNEEELWKAVGRSDLKKVKQALSKGINVNITDQWGYTPLIRTSVYGEKDIAELLIDKGAEVNARTDDGDTALLEASTSDRNINLAELLIEKGADVNIEDNSGFTPLIMASMNGEKEMVKLLIAKGANVNTETRHGHNALSMAWTHGEKEIMQILYDSGARDNSIVGFGDSN